jgi:hypothetical protein
VFLPCLWMMAREVSRSKSPQALNKAVCLIFAGTNIKLMTSIQ